jgi:uncharacterized membrane protein YvbJ
MSTTCPNCNHRNRSDAKYCGFCGANLTSSAGVKPVAPPIKQENTGTGADSKGQKQPKSKRFQTSQVVTVVAIILLFLLVILSVICRYWSELSQTLMQLLFSLYVRLPIL